MMSECVSEVEIAMSGRWMAARRLQRAREQLRIAMASNANVTGLAPAQEDK